MMIETRACPDCESGWRYADEVPEHPDAATRGLVHCPTCHGRGHVLLGTRRQRQDRRTG